MSKSSSLYFVILAAGRGTRMKSAKAKVLHPVRGKPMIALIVSRLVAFEHAKTVVVVGYQRDEIRKVLSEYSQIEYAVQEQQRGTGHAASCALAGLNSGSAVIFPGDVPLISNTIMGELIDRFGKSGKKLAFVVMEMEDPRGFGRVCVSASGVEIIEERDASDEIKKINQVNSGVYIGDVVYIKSLLTRLTADNAQREYYLTDIISLASRENQLEVIRRKDALVFQGVNTPQELANAEKIYDQFLKVKEK
jgi:bifunctional UDP-N-acetylglucosamine pyrophosphorylase/glucosamine-1-phosphate N-acetyltransferase